MSKKRILKISISGVRGIIGETLTPEVACNFAKAFGAYVGRGSVIVGRDTRPSGEMIQHAVIAGLLAVGCKPIVIGIVPTPTVLINVKTRNALGGIAITASHNPNEWNALKFVGNGGLFLNKIQAKELLDIYNQNDLELVSNSELRKVTTINDGFEHHLKKLYDKIDIAKIRKAGLRVAFDCCNGAGSLYTQKFLEDLGCKCFPVFADPTGIFPHGAEPIPENIGELCKVVKENGADIGFVQDPDADRLAIVNEKGEPIGEDYTLTLVADYILKQTKEPQKIVANLSISKSFDDVAKKYDAELIHTAIGEINVTEEIIKSKAIIGGEGNGGVIYPAVHPCRDSYIGMALILEAMADAGRSVTDLMNQVSRYQVVKKKFPMSAGNAYRLVKKLIHHNWDDDIRVQTLDGIRLDWKDRWALIRPSNTEPVIRIAAESATKEEAEKLVAELWEFCQSLV